MAPSANFKDIDAIDKAPRRPHIVLVSRTRLPAVSSTNSHHSVTLQLSLFSPANPTKPRNMTTLEARNVDPLSDSSQGSRPSSAAGSLPSSVQQSMGLAIQGPIEEFVINMKRDFLHRFNRIDDRLDENSEEIRSLKKSVNKLEERFENLEERFDNFQHSVDQRFDNVEQRFNDIEQRFNDMEHHLRRIEALLIGRQNPTPGSGASVDLQQGNLTGEASSQRHDATDVQTSPPRASQPVQRPQLPPISPTNLVPPPAPVVHASKSSSSLRSGRSGRSIIRALLPGRKSSKKSTERMQGEGVASPTSPTSPISPASPASVYPTAAGQQQSQQGPLDRRIDPSRD
ncbi:hypothetical protein PYCCODRAFT_1470348 [Trametes coccinea BRFM310]|uniref:Uncharacterized protein n=1 Tax=Trametes coccinea (strain BRFM310) TaxID=1353009 RepID=A0A1Y2IDV2_TRAC3|nr:hypothetical protein PYCCODRAFT_1470348 [Trametes coccinea BRFM310]